MSRKSRRQAEWNLDDAEARLYVRHPVETDPNSSTDRSGNVVRRASLPAGIADQMRRRILTGELSPGTRLPGHRELAAMYSVSVGSVREAISMLVSAGLVET